MSSIGRESNKSVNLIYALVTKDNCKAKLAVIRDLMFSIIYDNAHYGKKYYRTQEKLVRFRKKKNF